MVTRILPAVSDPDAGRALLGMLGRLPDTEPWQPATDSGQLLDLLDRAAAGGVSQLPETVLVHELIGPVPALDLIREVALRFPAVGVVLVTQDTSPGLYSAAMDSGARGVLGLPLNQDALATRIAAAASWAEGVRRHLGVGPDRFEGAGGAVFAVAGAKGGVGATLAAVQIALAARASGHDTALIDMNLQSGDVASFLDVQFRRSVADLAGISDLSPRVVRDAVYTHETGLALLLAPGEGERGEEVDDRTARQVVGAVRSRYQVVVIDCGTQMHAANAAALELADRAVLLTTPDVVSVRAAKRMVRMWERLRVRKPEEVVTAVNRASRHTEIQPQLIARIVGTPIAEETVPANFKDLHAALDAGRIQDLDHRSQVKQALWSLAAELGAASNPASGRTSGRTSGKASGRTSGKDGRSGRSQKSQKAGRSGKHTGESPAALDGGNPAALPPGGDRGFLRLWGRSGGPPWDDRGAVTLPFGSRTRPRGADRAADPAPVARTSAARTGPERTDGAADTAPDSGSGTGRAADPPAPGPAAPEARPRSVRSRARARTRLARVRRRLERATAADGERGALSVEFAGMVPIVLVVLAILWQCVLIGYTFTLAGNSADEGARAAASAAAYGDPAAACEDAARAHLPSAWDDAASVDCYVSGNVWKADVDLETPVLFPGAANLPFTVNGSAGAALEAEEE